MPESLPQPAEYEELEDDDSDDSASPVPNRSGSRSRPTSQRSGGSGASAGSRSGSGLAHNGNNIGSRPLSQTGLGSNQRSRSITRATTTNKLTALQRSNVVSFVFLLYLDILILCVIYQKYLFLNFIINLSVQL